MLLPAEHLGRGCSVPQLRSHSGIGVTLEKALLLLGPRPGIASCLVPASLFHRSWSS